MKTFDLQPTHENVLDMFEKDMLNRNIDVLRFTELLNSIESSCSIALDARWGAGKTFFVKQVKLVLDAFNAHIENSHTEDRERVQRVWNNIGIAKKPDLQPQLSVYYDAWINDNDEDPILSLVYSILQSVSSDFSFTQKPGFLDIASSIAEAVSGRSIVAIRDAMRCENPLDKIRSAKSMQEQVAEFLESLLAERGNRLVIFIDELDRCNPAFAIKLLERIKHYFSNSRITFVFSVNVAELQHAIRNHYGSEFDASRYLDRFFDLRIDLPPATMDRFYQEIGLIHGWYVYETVCKTIVEQNHFTLREIVKFYRMARAAAYVPTHDDKKYAFHFSDGKATQFCLMFLVPIMTGLKIGDYRRYVAFWEGKDSSPLHDLLKNSDVGFSLRRDLLADNETFDEAKKTEKLKLVTIEEKLEELYHALFIREYTSRAYEVRVGQLSFDHESRSTLHRAASALSQYTDFDA